MAIRKYSDRELGITPRERGKYLVLCHQLDCGIERQPHTALDHLRERLTSAARTVKVVRGRKRRLN